MASELLPACAATAQLDANLLLLKKTRDQQAGARPGLRPIGIPETLRKLEESALARMVRAATGQLCAPLQVGVVVHSPCVRILHEVCVLLDAHPEWAVLLLDLRNAFSLMSRVAACAVFEAAFPVL